MGVRAHDPGNDFSSAALLVVDLQRDFLPGGALAVAHGDEVIEPIRELMLGRAFAVYVATQDWHPPAHASFASSYSGRRPLETIQLHGQDQILWPDHCIQGTPGAELCAELPWSVVSAIIRKGTDPASDSYSGFRNNWDARGQRSPTGLAGYLRERGTEQIYICGLARDFCCKWTAEDAASAGFRTHFLWDLTRAVDPASDEGVRQELSRRGIEILTHEFIPDIQKPRGGIQGRHS